MKTNEETVNFSIINGNIIFEIMMKVMFGRDFEKINSKRFIYTDLKSGKE